jgi:hypothetical protein
MSVETYQLSFLVFIYLFHPEDLFFFFFFWGKIFSFLFYFFNWKLICSYLFCSCEKSSSLK